MKVVIDDFRLELTALGEIRVNDLLERAGACGRKQVDGRGQHHRKSGIDVWQLRSTLVETRHMALRNVGVADGEAPINGQAVGHVLIHETIVVEAPQNVAERENEAIAEQPPRFTQRAAGTERFRLTAVRDAHAESRAVAKMLFNDLALVTGEQHKIAQASIRERFDHALKIRTPTDLDHRLRHVARQSAEARAEAAAEGGHDWGHATPRSREPPLTLALSPEGRGDSCFELSPPPATAGRGLG